MSDILICVVNRLVEYKLLHRDVTMEAAMKYIESLSEEDQNTLIDLCREDK